jgi:hypothetical protein
MATRRGYNCFVIDAVPIAPLRVVLGPQVPFMHVQVGNHISLCNPKFENELRKLQLRLRDPLACTHFLWLWAALWLTWTGCVLPSHHQRCKQSCTPEINQNVATFPTITHLKGRFWLCVTGYAVDCDGKHSDTHEDIFILTSAPNLIFAQQHYKESEALFCILRLGTRGFGSWIWSV